MESGTSSASSEVRPASACISVRVNSSLPNPPMTGSDRFQRRDRPAVDRDGDGLAGFDPLQDAARVVAQLT